MPILSTTYTWLGKDLGLAGPGVLLGQCLRWLVKGIRVAEPRASLGRWLRLAGSMACGEHHSKYYERLAGERPSFGSVKRFAMSRATCDGSKAYVWLGQTFCWVRDYVWLGRWRAK